MAADWRQDPLDYGQTYPNDRTDFNHRSSATRYQQLGNHRVDGGVYSGAGIVANNKSTLPGWSPDLHYEVARETISRRTGRATISDRSETTASSRSDPFIPQVHIDDLQVLSLGNHPASHMVLPYGASSHSHHDDPILGGAQRKYDKEVQKSLGPAYTILGSNGERETLDLRKQ
ncbi:hypothetical protein N7447_001457 [Penicillium robsamsonii]|uniref:uncharacterized protein n=1 Tax=Penicillium robsamsonii TaxID=1792511 RepID=UPI002548EE90|nr:uncharacterized protein N7447_001457 [Penicillium robsamsonii]KAJ5835431.1 hypothetical protein N7447_001457 [Penicillium robsamsonii]